MSNDVVAIDGPSASGKSTVARRVAGEFGFLYVDSGALYRALTWHALRTNVDVRDFEAVANMLPSIEMVFTVADGAVNYRLNGEDPGLAIRRETVNRAVSYVAANPPVREKVVGWLREMAALGPLVVEGRDIGTAVFPGARWKFYLDASHEVRAQRRHAEMAERDEDTSVTAVAHSLKRRDSIDSTRSKDPLRIAEGAVIVDSTALSIDEVVAAVVADVRCDLAGETEDRGF
jgi:CMP/dCMP kinase